MNGVALLFPGQGSHFVGMRQELYHEYQVAKRVFEEANDEKNYPIMNYNGRSQPMWMPCFIRTRATFSLNVSYN